MPANTVAPWRIEAGESAKPRRQKGSDADVEQRIFIFPQTTSNSLASISKPLYFDGE
jgi:hypothetical protein